MLQLQGSIHRALSFIIIGTCKQSYLFVIHHQAGFHSMGIVFLLQIHHFRADITYRTTFVGHILNTHITSHRELTIGILYDMIVTVQHTRHTRSIRDDRCDFLQIKLMQAECQVLQGIRVTLLRVEADTHAIVCTQVDLCLDLSTATQEYVVVFVKGKLLISQRRTVGHQTKVDTSIDNLGLCSYACTQLVVSIEISHTKGCSAFLQDTVEEGVEDELRILLIVTHLTTKRQALLALDEREVDSIKTNITNG